MLNFQCNSLPIIFTWGVTWMKLAKSLSYFNQSGIRWHSLPFSVVLHLKLHPHSLISGVHRFLKLSSCWCTVSNSFYTAPVKSKLWSVFFGDYPAAIIFRRWRTIGRFLNSVSHSHWQCFGLIFNQKCVLSFFNGLIFFIYC